MQFYNNTKNLLPFYAKHEIIDALLMFVMSLHIIKGDNILSSFTHSNVVKKANFNENIKGIYSKFIYTVKSNS